MRLRFFLYSSVIFLCSVIACKKEDNTPPPPPVINAFFSIEHSCTVPEINTDSVNYIDSTFKFINLSDVGQLVTYKWSFGDGSISSDINPIHSYQKSGNYTVTLITNYQGNPSDTFTRGIRVIIGQKRYTAGTRYTNAVDIAPADENGVMGLVQRFDSYANPPEYSLFKTDSVLKQLWIKPINGTTVRLESLKRLNDGNYIAAGNYSPGNINEFAISKINGQGDMVWTKFITGLTGKNIYASETADGGILTIGNGVYQSPGGTIWFYTAIVKCDANGNELWRKTYNSGPEVEFMSDPLNFIEINGEYIFPSFKRNSPADSIVMTRLNANGNILQQSSVPFNGNSSVFGVGLAKAGNTFLVYLTNTRTAAFFNNNLSFIKYLDVAQSGITSAAGKGDKFYLIEGNFQYAVAIRLNEDGSQNWSTILGGWIRLPSCGGLMSGATRYGKQILLSSFGDVVAMTYGQDDPASFNSSSTYLYRYTENGTER